ADSATHCDFALPRFTTREEQIRHVDTSDEQHEDDGAEQYEPGLSHTADYFVIEQIHGDGMIMRRERVKILRCGPTPACHQPRHLIPRLGQSDARPKPGDD